MLPQIQVVIIHYGTHDLLEDAVRSFRSIYPDVALHIVDNGSPADDVAAVRQLAATYQATTELLPGNIFHGPAMHRALVSSEHDLVFFLDSDTITHRGGFLEAMAEQIMSEPNILGSGHVVPVSRRGFAAQTGIPVPASAYMMVHRSHYSTLPPFIHHGLPVLGTCKAAQRRGLVWSPFPVADYVNHLGRGTAARYGYGLGWRSRLDYLLNRLGL